MKRHFIIRILLLSSLILVPYSARSTTDRFPAFDLWPSIADPHFFTTSSSQGLYRLRYSFELSNVYAFRPLDLLNPAGTRVRSVVDYYFGHFFSGALGLTDFWQVGFTLPLFSRARFESATADPSPGPENVFEIGDLKTAMKLRVIDSNRHRFGLAFEPFATIPLGADNHFLGESKATGGVKVIGDVLLTDRLRLALNLGAEIRAERVVISNVDFNHRFLSSIGLAADLGKRLTASVEANASSPFGSFLADKDVTPVEFLAGVQWDVGDSGLKIGAGGGTCAVCGGRGAKARAFLNVGYRRMNESFSLKEKQEAKMRVVSLGGAKPALEAEEIYELVDKCPVTSAGYQVGRDDPRCMQVYELQTIASACPEEGTFNPDVDNPKCRQIYTLQVKDVDQDGVPDFQDRCPTEAGKKGEWGCPSIAYLQISPEENKILTQTINFDFGRATLRKDALPILNHLASAIHSQPAIQKLSIEGHTDDIGTKGQNLALSRARARAVANLLIRSGVNPERLDQTGYGETKPIDDNSTEEGRSRNRRVEFLIKKVGNLP